MWLKLLGGGMELLKEHPMFLLLRFLFCWRTYPFDTVSKLNVFKMFKTSWTFSEILVYVQYTLFVQRVEETKETRKIFSLFLSCLYTLLSTMKYPLNKSLVENVCMSFFLCISECITKIRFRELSQSAFTCSKLTIETLEHGAKYVQS